MTNLGLLFFVALSIPFTSSQSSTVISFPQVGGCGSYNKVTNMIPGVFPTCPSAPPPCQQNATQVGGPLSPLNEDISVILRGPMHIYNFAAFQPSTNDETQPWTKVSSYSSSNPGAAVNLVAMNNNGGGPSGVWTICGGNSQSYANATGDGPAAGPTPFGGYLANEVTVNFMTANQCDSSCGFYRDVGMKGWTGNAQGAKAFAIEVDMPAYTGCGTTLGYCNAPAIWILNSQVVRTAQWGCNCRGSGGGGGCGELDVAEVVPSGSDANQINYCSSTLYTYHGSLGSGTYYFARPYTTSVVFVVIFSATNDKIQEIMLPNTGFDFTAASLTGAQITSWLGLTGATIQLPNYNTSCYGSSPTAAPPPPPPPATTPTPATPTQPATPVTTKAPATTKAAGTTTTSKITTKQPNQTTKVPSTTTAPTTPPPTSCSKTVSYRRCWGLGGGGYQSTAANCAQLCCTTQQPNCTTWSWAASAGCYTGKASSCSADTSNTSNTSGVAVWWSGGALVAAAEEATQEPSSLIWFKSQGYWIVVVIVIILILLIGVLFWSYRRRTRSESSGEQAAVTSSEPAKFTPLVPLSPLPNTTSSPTSADSAAVPFPVENVAEEPSGGAPVSGGESEGEGMPLTSQSSQTQLLAPVWVQKQDETGNAYYYNQETGASQWEAPDV